MHLILVRHSEPNYSDISKYENSYIPTKAHLSITGANFAYDKFNKNKNILNKGQIILASPFNRALETALILETIINKPLYIEDNLHEWLPDREFKYNISNLYNFYRDYKVKNGIRINNEPWEANEEVIQRFFKCIEKYKEFDTIIIVAHSRLFKILFNLSECDYCSINEIELEVFI